MACNEFNPCTDCGCEETAPVVPNPIECTPPSEPCESLITGNCVLYTGGNIPEVNIVNGDSLNSVIEKLCLYISSLP